MPCRPEAPVESKEAERKTGTTPSHPLADYVGEFEHPGYGVITVTLEGDALAVELHGLKAKLEHWHYDVFNTLKNPDEPVLDDSASCCSRRISTARSTETAR